MDYKRFSLIFQWKKNASHTDLVSVMLIMIYRSPMSTQFVFVWLTHSYREHFSCWILKTLLRRIWWVCKYAADDVLPHFIAQFSPRLIYELQDIIESPVCTILHCLRCLNFGKHCAITLSCALVVSFPLNAPPAPPPLSMPDSSQLKRSGGLGEGASFHNLPFSSYMWVNPKWVPIFCTCVNAITYGKVSD